MLSPEFRQTHRISFMDSTFITMRTVELFRSSCSGVASGKPDGIGKHRVGTRSSRWLRILSSCLESTRICESRSIIAVGLMNHRFR